MEGQWERREGREGREGEDREEGEEGEEGEEALVRVDLLVLLLQEIRYCRTAEGILAEVGGELRGGKKMKNVPIMRDEYVKSSLWGDRVKGEERRRRRRRRMGKRSRTR